MQQLRSDSDAVRAANLEFYRAFTARDAAAMDALWARAAPVLCIHPGWMPIHGRAAVMESWRGILANPESPRVMCHDDQAFLYGDIAIVLCEEELPDVHLAATNIFVREGNAWRLVHHQASPIFARPDTASPSSLH
jgi:ketosteroid isomerase-like protein